MVSVFKSQTSYYFENSTIQIDYVQGDRILICIYNIPRSFGKLILNIYDTTTNRKLSSDQYKILYIRRKIYVLFEMIKESKNISSEKNLRLEIFHITTLKGFLILKRVKETENISSLNNNELFLSDSGFLYEDDTVQFLICLTKRKLNDNHKLFFEYKSPQYNEYIRVKEHNDYFKSNHSWYHTLFFIPENGVHVRNVTFKCTVKDFIEKKVYASLSTVVDARLRYRIYMKVKEETYQSKKLEERSESFLKREFFTIFIITILSCYLFIPKILGFLKRALPDKFVLKK
uniref:GOLD domain-containing protein n=1 Tax=Parastrongyloides trichosuri TaxID=131310 RepID=A0A0N4ZV16_PARTI